MKVARSVLRGESGGNAADLLDFERENMILKGNEKQRQSTMANQADVQFYANDLLDIYLSPSLHTHAKLLIIILAAIFLTSCMQNKRRDDVIKIVSKWTGKEIKLPNQIPCYIFGKEALPELCEANSQKDFKILLYVDSIGCSSCRLQLSDWKKLIEEINNLFIDQVGFMLYFQPKNIIEMRKLFISEEFTYPVYIDKNDEINRLNQFPLSMSYQCFLLDSNNKVLIIGNPILNFKIRELYISKIANGVGDKTTNLTSINVDKIEFNFGTIRKNNTYKAIFTITNKGENILVIKNVTTSCGCTNISWDKQPIKPEKSTTILIDMTPNEIGNFRKIVMVYTNSCVSPTKLTLVGTTIE